MKTVQIATALLLAGSAAAAPTNCARSSTTDATAAALVAQIAPAAASATCSPTDECRTAAQAGPLLEQAMKDYNITSAGEKAGVYALMAFESVNFEYKHNVSPGRPGQGTANMQMFNYNLEYAKSIPALAGEVGKVGSTDTDAGKNAVLALVTDDKYNFGSGPWFLVNHCANVRSTLAAGTDAGFAAYMQCVGVSVTEERNAYWQRAKAAFGL
ncbi:hypothetical protein JX265_007696 [Neoarthrinium moseri]|uniref:Uncharacterized protein n=1 Tax=Neoarthrinium moseri TaxID=1658444 RepID=A0A9P9WJ49_9PEZI|nr:hypothetical protein JX265_007696 [Neoarthrinium moseri]